jgi:hypothetical protein
MNLKTMLRNTFIALAALGLAQCASAVSMYTFTDASVTLLDDTLSTSYDLQGTVQSNPFSGANLGTYSIGTDTLVIDSLVANMTSTSLRFATQVILYYRVYASSGVAGSYSSVSLINTSTVGTTQTWSVSGQGIDLLSGLSNGVSDTNYKVDMYVYTTNSTYSYVTSSSVVTGTFTVVPEPASCAAAFGLVGLGGAMLAKRKLRSTVR